MDKMLKQAFEALQMNVGLEGNISVCDFSRLGELAEDFWFKKIWELCHRFKVALIIHEIHDVLKTRQRDKALMECFVNYGVCNINKLSVSVSKVHYSGDNFTSYELFQPDDNIGGSLPATQR